MIDAYTIGITLALNDGVSAGIDQIRRDLQLLDQAIAQTAIGLSTLQRLGQDIGLPQLPQPVRPDRTQPKLHPQREVETSTGAPAPAPIAPMQVRERPPQWNELRAFETAAPERPSPTQVSFSAIAAPLVGNNAPAASRDTNASAGSSRPPVQPEPRPDRFSPTEDRAVAALPRDTPGASAPELGVPFTTESTATPGFAAFAPRMALPTQTEERNRPQSMLIAASAPPQSSEPDLAPSPINAGVALDDRQAISPRVDGRLPPFEANANDRSIIDAPLSFRPYAPRGQVTALIARTGVEAAPSAGPDSNPRPNPSDAVRAGGAGKSVANQEARILVDGRVLGRLVSDQLAAQLVRPQHGYTGVDPRAVPTWPGAPVG